MIFVRGGAGVAEPRVSAKDEPGPPQVRSLRQSRREARRGLDGGRRNSRGRPATSAGSRGLTLGTCLAELGAPQVTLGTGGWVTAAESYSFIRYSPLPTTALGRRCHKGQESGPGWTWGCRGSPGGELPVTRGQVKREVPEPGRPRRKVQGPCPGARGKPPPPARPPPPPSARTREE